MTVILIGADIRISKVISKGSYSMISTVAIFIFIKLEIVKMH